MADLDGIDDPRAIHMEELLHIVARTTRWSKQGQCFQQLVIVLDPLVVADGALGCEQFAHAQCGLHRRVQVE